MVHQHGFRAKTWYYQWNTLNQLIACFNPEGECWRYTYDAFGRRFSKSTVVDNRPTPPLNSPFKDKRIQRVDYLWSGNQMGQETPIYADGTPAYDSQIQWLYQPNEITPTARYQRGKLHYVVTDHQGTPREIFSEKGIVSWAGRLNTWGQMAFWQSHDNYADNDAEYTECHFRFAGQYEDKESGLYYNRFRYYDKDTGQYISPDPIGLLGGFNPYGYVHCPTGWVDPFGLAGGQGNKGEVESFYRSMSSAHYEHLINNNQLKPTSETFLSPTLGFSESYTGILVRFDLKPGTTKALENIGVRDISKATRESYPDMPIISKGWNKFNAYFKAEGEQINIGLGKGKALEIFNDNIKKFEKSKEIKKD